MIRMAKRGPTTRPIVEPHARRPTPAPALHLCYGRLLCHHVHMIIRNLQEAAFNVESMRAGCTDSQFTIPEQGHHRSVTGENSDFTVERRRDH